MLWNGQQSPRKEKIKQVKIKYCVPCSYLPRAEEFKKALKDAGVKVELVEGDRGVFDVWVDSELVFSKHTEGRFPKISEITKNL